MAQILEGYGLVVEPATPQIVEGYGLVHGVAVAAESATLTSDPASPLARPLTGKHLKITVDGAEWITAGFDDIRAAIRDNVTGSLAGAGTWDGEKSNIPVTAVTRFSATEVRIALDDIEAHLTGASDETLSSGDVLAAWTDSSSAIAVDGSVTVLAEVTATLMAMSRGTHRRVFGRVFGRVN